MLLAEKKDIREIVSLYRTVVDAVNKTNIKLGWNPEVYPNEEFVRQAIEFGQMCILKKEEKIIAVAVVNHSVNVEYDDVDWRVNQPKEKIATIHAFATLPEYRGKTVADQLLKDIADYCKDNGDVAIHLDVIDTNIPAYKMYIRNGYTEADCIKMIYEVVGEREFWMLEKVL